MRLAVPRRTIATIVASLILFIPPLHAQDEVRALWVVRTTLTSPSAIATMVKDLPLPPIPSAVPDWAGAAKLAREWELKALSERLTALAGG